MVLHLPSCRTSKTITLTASVEKKRARLSHDGQNSLFGHHFKTKKRRVWLPWLNIFQPFITHSSTEIQPHLMDTVPLSSFSRASEPDPGTASCPSGSADFGKYRDRVRYREGQGLRMKRLDYKWGNLVLSGLASLQDALIMGNSELWDGRSVQLFFSAAPFSHPVVKCRRWKAPSRPLKSTMVERQDIRID